MSSNNITVLEGNEIVNTTRIQVNGGPIFEKGTTFTIKDVVVNERASSGFSFSLEEIDIVNFDACVHLFTDKYPISEEVIKEWVDETDHPEGI